MEGRERRSNFCVVDVRDVCDAHIAAMERPEAKGRHIVSSKSGLQPSYCAKVLKEAFPTLPIDVEGHKQFDEKVPQEIFDASKAERELGIKFRPVEQSLIDMAKSLLEFGIVEAKL
eukprot:TRINITY_DN2050_c0_g1_i2.p2 TRINITY_DN2050_c0_g1~~TRINITY_DN2050_c0_g1_i2.p2  ORF type:complete len:116 (-),score=28.23 TRINITY_DN2050_c0_g1_i2:119-466(-)